MSDDFPRDRAPLSGRAASARQLLVHAAVCLAAAAGALLFKSAGLRFWPCMFHAVTGYYCLTCGSTRAVFALLRLDLKASFLSCPLPLLLIVLIGSMMVTDLAGVVRNRRIAYRYLPHGIIAIVAVLVVYCILRNIGLAPAPPA